ncbi:ESPR-type extended signal peptide-containing protein [Glaesserella parasuis]|uniref:ESPR-type extended signal peptide-containing protein n=2 Tax=Glaesserella parasuis TaxID=738 RepID=UPI002436C394|nr:ESPR-type extended signal peptide-containing protein [Glaesserella parasuis]MDG6471199.1 ESPR-type extended signal peptide-containing protein [Glaesserella parasuis]MDO9731270.1 ESPR-type extended signal peptide-containing protein [Glaesserella parasuis]
MNKIFRVIWSHAQQAWVVVSELVKSHGKSAISIDKRISPNFSAVLLEQQNGFSLSPVTKAILVGLLGLSFADFAYSAAVYGNGATDNNDWSNVAIGDQANALNVGGWASGDNGSDNVVIGYKAKTVKGGHKINPNLGNGSGAVVIGAKAQAVEGAIAIGKEVKVQTLYGIAIGRDATVGVVTDGKPVSGEYSIAIGSNEGTHKTEALGDIAIAMGRNAKARGYASMALGWDTQANATSSLAMMYAAQATGFAAVAVGRETRAGNHSTALGGGANATGTRSIAIGAHKDANSTWSGSGAEATGEDSIALGTDATASAAKSIAIGRESKAEGDHDSVAIGQKSNAKAYGTAVGSNAKAETDSAALGNTANASTKDSVAVGAHTTASGLAAVAIGSSVHNTEKTRSQATASNTIAIGGGKATQAEAISIGAKSQATQTQSIAIGSESSASAAQAVTIGSNTVASGYGAISIGGDDLNTTEYHNVPDITTYFGTTASGKASVAIGGKSNAIGDGSVVVGPASRATNKEGVVIGAKSSSTADYGIAVGSSATAGSYAVAVGKSATASQTGTSAFGEFAEATAQRATALGNHSKADVENGVALGYMSKTTRNATNNEGWKQDTSAYSALNNNVRTATHAAVAVGNDTAGSIVTRQITGVAAGSQDTDAVNLAQLKALTLNIKGQGNTTGDVTLSTETLELVGENGIATTVDQANGKTKIKIRGSTTTYKADGGMSANKLSTGDSGYVADSQSNTVSILTTYDWEDPNGGNVQKYKGENIQSIRKENGDFYLGIKESPTFKTVTASESVTVTGGPTISTNGIDMGNKQITNLAEGTQNDHAVNKGQLDNATVTYFHTNTGDRTQGEGDQATNKGKITDKAGARGRYSITAGVNAKATADYGAALGHGSMAGSYAVAVGNDSKATGTDSVAVGNTARTTGADSVAVGAHINVTGEKLVAIGRESKADGYSVALGYKSSAGGTGSVAVGEMAVTNENVHRATALGNNSIVTVGGGVALGYGSRAETAGDIEGAKQSHSLITGTSTVENGFKSTREANGNVIGAVSVGTGAGNNLIKRQIVNVAAGKELTDAVNVAQLQSLTMQTGGDNSSSGKVGIWNGKLEVKGTNGEIKTNASGSTITISLDDTIKNQLANARTGSLTFKGEKTETGATNDVSGQKWNANEDKTVTIASSETYESNGVRYKGDNVEIYRKNLNNGNTEFHVLMKDAPTFSSVQYGDNGPKITSAGSNLKVTGADGSSPVKITNVANGEQDNDAVNFSQLNPLITKITNLESKQIKYFSVNSTGGGNVNNDGATKSNAIAIGRDATASQNQAVALGKGATSNGLGAVAIGGQFDTEEEERTYSMNQDGSREVHSNAGLWAKVQYNAEKKEGEVGKTRTTQATSASGMYSVAIGSKTRAEGNGALALGYAAYAKGGGVALGLGAAVGESDGISIGTFSATKAAASIALGYFAKAENKHSLAFGRDSKAAKDGGVALGFKSEATIAGGQIGAKQAHSVKTEELKSTEYIVPNTQKPQEKEYFGAVSVGKADGSLTRQIVGVAAGTADTDATNVAQLKSLTMKIGGNTNETTQPKVGLWEGTLNVKGENGLTSHASGDTITVKLTDEIKQKIDDLETKVNNQGITFKGNTGQTGSIKLGDTLKVEGVTDETVVTASTDKLALGLAQKVKDEIAGKMSSFKIKANDTGEQEITNGNTIVFKNGKNINVTRNDKELTFATTEMPEFTSVQYGNDGPKITKDNDGNLKVTKVDGNAPVKITNVAEGTETNDAVNKGQLDNVTVTYFHTNTGEQTQGKGEENTNKGKITDKAGATGKYAVTAGVNTKATANQAVAIGKDTKATASSAIAIGSGKPENPNGLNLIKARYNPTKKEVEAGHGFDPTDTETVASGSMSLAIGGLSQATGHVSVALGAYSYALGHEAIAIGSRTAASGAAAVAIGSFSAASGGDAVAIGWGAKARGDFSSALGLNAKALNKNAIAIGNGATAGIEKDTTNISTVAIGESAVASHKETIAIGKGAKATAEKAISIGTGNTVSGAKSGAIGDPNTVSGAASYVMGNDNTVTHTKAFVLGNNVTTGADDSVYLGDSSAVNTGDSSGGVTSAVASGEINGITYGNFAATTPVGVVTVGAATKERRIQNVAAGKISATSTDAINGSQLYLTNNVIGNIAKTIKPILGGDADYKTSGDEAGKFTMTNIGATGKNNIHDAIIAAKSVVKAGKNISSVDTKNETDGSKTYTVNAYKTTVAKADNDTLITVSGGDANNENVLAYKVGVTKGSFAGTTDGKLSQQAAGVATVNDVATAVNAGYWKAKSGSKTSNIKFGDTLTFADGDATTAKLSDDGKVSYDVKYDGSTITKTADGKLKVNTDNLPKTTFKVKANKENDDQAATVSDQDVVTFKSGTNIDVSRNGKEFTISMSDTPTFNSVTITGTPTEGNQAVNKTYADGLRTTVQSSDESIRVEDTDTNANKYAYDIKVNYDKVAQNAKLSYQANKTGKKEVALSTGLDFTNTDNITASVEANGVVKHSLNENLKGISSIANSAADDATKISLTGSGDNKAVDVHGAKITNVAKPTENTDAANKKYVDDTNTEVAVGNGLTLSSSKNATGGNKYTVSLDTSALPSGSIKYKGEGDTGLQDARTVELTTGLTFKNGDYTVATTEDGGNVKIDLNDTAKAKLNDAGQDFKVGVSATPADTDTTIVVDENANNKRFDIVGKDEITTTISGRKVEVALSDETKTKIGKIDGLETKVNNQGITFEADAGSNGNKKTNPVKLGSELKIAGGTNIGTTVSDDKGAININLDDDVVLSTEGSVAFGSDGTRLTTLDNDGLTVKTSTAPDAKTIEVTKDGIKAGDKKIKDVAAGEVNTNSKEAVTGSQLHNFIKVNNEAVAKDGVVKFIDGTGTTVEKTNNGEIKVNVNTGTSKVGNDGKAAPTDDTHNSKVATVKDVTDSINATFWKATTGTDGTGTQADGTASKLAKVKSGDEVKFKAGNNLIIKQDGTENRDFTYSLNKDVDLKDGSVKFNKAGETATSVQLDENGLTIKATDTTKSDVKLTAGGLDNGNNKIVNVAKPEADTDAANKKYVDDGRTVVVQGDNITVTSQKDDATGKTTYTVKGKKTTVSKVDNSPITVTPDKETAEGVTNYKIGIEVDGTTIEVKDGKLASKVVDTDKSAKVIGSDLVTVDTATERTEGITKVTDYTVKVKKGAFGNTTDGKIVAGTEEGNSTGVATVGDVVSAVNAGYWKAKSGDVTKNVKFGDTIEFVAGSATTASITDEGKVSYSVNVDNSTIKVNSDGKLYATLQAPQTTTLNVSDTAGTVTVPTGGDDKFVTATHIADAINKSGWIATSDSATSKSEALVKAGEKVKFEVAGSNLTLTQDGKKFTYGLANTLNLTTDGSVKFGDNGTTLNNSGLTIPATANGKTAVSLTSSGLNNGGNQITNVASGEDVETNGANIGDVKRIAGASVEKVKQAEGTDNLATVTPATTAADAYGKAGTEYVVSVSKNTVTNVAKEAAKASIDVKGTSPISVTSKEENGKKTYTVAYNATEAAGVTNLSYKADGGASQNTTLTNGLDFTSTKNITASVEAGGVVKHSLNENLKGITSIANGDGTTKDNGAKITLSADPNNKTVDVNDAKITNVAAGTVSSSSKDAINGTQLHNFIKANGNVVNNSGSVNFADGNHTKINTDTVGTIKVDVKTGTFGNLTSEGKLSKATDGVATINDVVTEVNKGYWTAKVNGNTEVAKVKFGDTLDFVDGSVTTARMSEAGKVTFDVKVDDSSIKIVDGKLVSTLKAPETTTLTVSEADDDTKGKVTNVAEGDKNKFVTADNIANVINKSGWVVTSTTAEAAGKGDQLVKAGDKVNLEVGDNLKLVQEDRKFTYSLQDNLKGVVSIAGSKEDDKGAKITLSTGDVKTVTLNNANITGLADGKLSDDSTDAVTGKQLHNFIKVNNAAVETGGTVTFADGLGTTVSAEGGTLKVNVTTGSATVGNDGKAKPTSDNDNNKIATVKNITDTINDIFWNVTSGVEGLGKQADGNQAQIVNVKASNTVTLKAGDNLIIKQDGTGNRDFTYALNKNLDLKDGEIKFNATTSADTTVKLDETGLTITKTSVDKGDVKLTATGLDNGKNKVINVADGDVNATSTDAVTGKQLHNLVKVKDAAAEKNGSVNFVDGTTTNVSTTDGKISFEVNNGALSTTLTVNETSTGDKKAGTVEAPSDGNKNKFVNAENLATTLNKIGFNVERTGSNKIANSEDNAVLVKAGDTVQFEAGSNLEAGRDGTKFTYRLTDTLKNITSISNGTEGIGTKITLSSTSKEMNVGGAKISNVAAPTENTDAATKKYVDDSRTTVTSGSDVLTITDANANDQSKTNKAYTITLNADKLNSAANLSYKANNKDGKTTPLSTGLDFTNTTNITASVAENGVVKHTLNSELKGITSIASKADGTGTKVTLSTTDNDKKVTLNTAKITGVADGEIADGSSDVVTGKQLKDLAGQVGVEVNADKTTFKQPEFTKLKATSTDATEPKEAKTVVEALEATRSKVNEGLKFKGEEADGTKTITKQLGETLEIKSGDITNGDIAYKSGNLRVESDGSKIVVGLKEKPEFKEVTVKDGNNTTTVGATSIKVGDTTADDDKPVTITVGENGKGGSISNLETTLASTNMNKFATKPTNPTTTNAATLGDVLNSGWNLQGNGSAVDFVRAYDKVNFANGIGTTVNVSTDGETSTIKVDITKGELSVNTDGKVVDPVPNGKELLTALKNAKTALDEELKKPIEGNSELNQDTVSRLKAELAKAEADVEKAGLNKVATVKEVADAINNSGFKLISGADGGTNSTAETLKTDGEIIKPGDVLTMKAGKNIAVTHTAKGNITFATVENPVFTSVQFGDNNGPKISKDDNGNIKVSKKDGSAVKITNVANPTGDSDVVNKGYVDNIAAESKLKYTANGTTAKKEVKLSDGLDFKHTDNITASVEDNGVVKHTLNSELKGINSIASKTTDGTAEATKIELSNDVNDKKVTLNEAKVTGLKDGDVSANSKDAVTGKQLHNFIKVGDSAVAKDGVVKFADGTGTTVEHKDGSIKVNVKTSDLTTTLSNGGTTGVVNDPTDGDKLVTANTVKSAINNSGWVVSSTTSSADADNKKGDKLVKTGEKVNLEVGSNLLLKQDDKTFTYSLNPALTGLTSAEFKGADGEAKTNITKEGITITPATPMDAGKSEVKLTASGLNNGGNKITNVAEGTDDNDAVNVSQLNTKTAASKTEVESKDKSIGVSSIAGSSGQKIYDLSVNNAVITSSADFKTVEASKNGNAFATAENVAHAINTATAAATTEVTSTDGSVNILETRGDNGQNIYDLEVVRSALSISDDGKEVTSATTGDAFATGDDVANVVNKAAASARTEIKDGKNTKASIDQTGVDGQDIYKIDVEGELTGITSIANGNNYAKDNGTKISLSEDPNNKVVTLNDAKLTGLVDGNVTSTSKEAVTGKQLKDLADKIGVELATDSTTLFKIPEFTKLKANKDTDVTAKEAKTVFAALEETRNKVNEGLKFKGEETDGTKTITKQFGETLTIKSGDIATGEHKGENIAVESNGTEIVVGMKDALTNIKSIANGEENTGTKITLASDKKELNVNSAKVTGLADGKVSNDSTDATTGKQLYNLVKVNGTNAVNDIENNPNKGGINFADSSTVTIAKGTDGNVTMAVSNTTLSVADSGDNIGKVTAPNTDADKAKFVNADDLADTLNKMGFNVESGGNLATGDEDGKQLIKAGDTVKFEAGDGLLVKRVGSTFTYELGDSLKTNDLNVGEKGEKGKDGTISVNGKDGSAVVINGKDGSIGLNGKDGANGVTIKGDQGSAGVDGGKKTRIVYEYKDPTDVTKTITETIATLNDGLKFTGNNSDTVNKHKLNTLVTIKGEGVDKEKSKTFASATGNINVKADGTDTLEIQLAKAIDLTKDGSVKTGNTTMDNDGITIKKPTNAGDEKSDVKLTASGLDNGGNVISNVAQGKNGTDAVNVSQLNTKAAASKTEVESKDKSIDVSSRTGSNGQTIYNVEVVRSKLSISDDGKIVTSATTGNAFTTGDDVTNIVNKAAASARTELQNGKNTKVEVQSGADGHDIYKVNIEGDLADISSVANGKTKISLVKDKNELSVNGAKITNVAAGTADTDAVNVSQLNTKAAASKTEVESKDKSVGVTASKGDKDQTIYDLSVVKSKLNAAEDKRTVAAETKGNAFVTGEEVAKAINTTTAAARTEVTDGRNTQVVATTGENGQEIYNVSVSGLPMEYATEDGKSIINMGGNFYLEEPTADGSIKLIPVVNAKGKFSTKTQNPDGSVTLKPLAVKVNLANEAPMVLGNVAEGVADTDAVNVKQLKSAKTEVESTDHSVVIKERQGDNQQIVYDLTVAKTKLTASEDKRTISAEDKGNHFATGDEVAAAINTATAAARTEVEAGKNVKVTSKTGANGQNIYNVSVSGDLSDITSISNGDTKVSLGKDKQGNPVVNMNGARITNIGDGSAEGDVVNVRQLNKVVSSVNAGFNQLSKDIGRVDVNARAGIASAGAMANLSQVYLPGKSAISISGAQYRGQAAYAIGYSRISDNGKWLIRASVSSNTQRDTMIGGGASFVW